MASNTIPFVRLSYDIDETAPRFPSVSLLKRIRPTCIEKGDASNTSVIEIHSHYGTHVDVPFHFQKDGLKITDLDVNQYCFSHPFLMDLPKKEDEPIVKADFFAFEKAIRGRDLLLIRTGFSRYRKDHDKYLCNPYLAIDSAHYLIDQFPGLRAIGIDCISILNLKFRPVGIETHRILLGHYEKDRYLLVLEDLNLDVGERDLKEIIVLPLFVKDADAFPCTVIAR